MREHLSPEFKQFYVNNKDVIYNAVVSVEKEALISALKGELKKKRAAEIIVKQLGNSLPDVKTGNKWINLAIELAVQALPFILH
jgi:hypothetical protein